MKTVTATMTRNDVMIRWLSISSCFIAGIYSAEDCSNRPNPLQQSICGASEEQLKDGKYVSELLMEVTDDNDVYEVQNREVSALHFWA